MIPKQEESSFRDRDGFVFYHNDAVYRTIAHSYRDVWESLVKQDFFTTLIQEKKLVAYEEIPVPDFLEKDHSVCKVLRMEKIPFISYPGEWSFIQLKKAALLTLNIQKSALKNGYSLKDATAYNVQFFGPNAVFIDTLSFEIFREGEPWTAYGQFCRHFLAPLLLTKFCGTNMQQLFISNLDGIPLQLASSLLPWNSKLNALAYTHIHLHSKFENKHSADKEVKQGALKISKKRVLAILDHLYEGISNLKIPATNTNWTDYYDTCSYSREGYEIKKQFVHKHLQLNAGKLCIDLGANTGEFSVMASTCYKHVVACDNDMEVVRAIQSKKIQNLLALKIELTNPTPGYGWNGSERKSFVERASEADMVLALALIHHLCISNNVPLKKLAAFFAGFAKQLIIEFVPKTDIQVKKLLVTRRDIFDDYTYQNFIDAFSLHFEIIEKQEIAGSDRVLFTLKRISK